MSEYAFADIITGKDILTDQMKDEDIIGTKGYFAGDLKTIVDSFDDNTFPDSLLEGTLETVSYIGRFKRKEDGIYFDYFIRKKEPSYRERQAEWVEEVGLKSGDEVRILRKFEPNEGGFYYRMNSDGEMDPLVGKVLTVKDVEGDRIRVYNEDKTVTWVWPYFVLEKVWDAPRPMYTEDDIISGPFDKRVMAALGKEVYRGDDKDELLKAANDGDESAMGFLCEARIASDGFPFRIGLNWRYIIIPKIMPEGKPGEQTEEKPEEAEYVPFDLSKEEDRLKLCGSWVKSRRHPDECYSICGVSSHLVFISGQTPGSTAKEFLRDFTFLDGSPCGKLANGQQMTQGHAVQVISSESEADSGRCGK